MRRSDQQNGRVGGKSSETSVSFAVLETGCWPDSGNLVCSTVPVDKSSHNQLVQPPVVISLLYMLLSQGHLRWRGANSLHATCVDTCAALTAHLVKCLSTQDQSTPGSAPSQLDQHLNYMPVIFQSPLRSLFGGSSRN